MPVAQIYTGLQDTKIQEDTLYTVNVTSAFDVSAFSGAAVYSATLENGDPLPDWLTINAATGYLAGTPKHSDAWEIYHLSVTATDSAGIASAITQSYYLYVENINDAPQIAAETFYGTVQKSSLTAEDTGWIWAVDAERDDGYGWGLIHEYFPVITDEVTTTVDGVVTTVGSNVFGDKVVTERAQDWSQYEDVITLSSGLTWTESWYINSSGTFVHTVTSSLGHDSTSNDTYTQYDGYQDSVEINTGTNYIFNRSVEMNNVIFEVRKYTDGSSEMLNASGTATMDGREYQVFVTNSDDGFGIKASTSLGIDSLGFEGLLYDLPNQQGTYGTIALTEDGGWIYTLDKTDVDTIALGLDRNGIDGSTALETFDLHVSDGQLVTTKTIYIEVTGGLNDIEATADNTFNGTSAAETLTGNAGVNELYGEAGNDVLVGGDSGDALYGGVGDDRLAGDDGADRLYSGAGADLLDGGAGADEIYLQSDGIWSGGYIAYNAGAGNGDIGTAEIISLQGLNRYDDVIVGGTDYDCLVLGEGGDAFFLEDAFSAHHTSLTLASTSLGPDSIARLTSVDAILAGGGNDVIDLTTVSFTGLSNDVLIYGEAGDDHLWGGAGNDRLNGGVGDDSLVGGSGTDSLTGGDGADEFVFTTSSGTNSIIDFNTIEHDSIHLYYRSSTVDHLTAEQVDAWLYSNLALDVNVAAKSATITWDSKDVGGEVKMIMGFTESFLSDISTTSAGDQFLLDNISFHEIV